MKIRAPTVSGVTARISLQLVVVDGVTTRGKPVP
jgi:hypothetical protein